MKLGMAPAGLSCVTHPSIHSALATTWLVPAGRDVLELDKGLSGDVQLIDDGAEDVGVILCLHLHVVAVTVCHREEDPLANVEDLPVCGTECLEQMKSGPGESGSRGQATNIITTLPSDLVPTLPPRPPGCHPITKTPEQSSSACLHQRSLSPIRSEVVGDTEPLPQT